VLKVLRVILVLQVLRDLPAPRATPVLQVLRDLPEQLALL
jgi:hypothetical protein